MAAPAAKKAKTGDGEDAKKGEEEKKEEEAQELEVDALPDKAPRIKAAVVCHAEDTTMNCMPAASGSMFLPLSDGGLQYLLAGARACVGLKGGRYMFEAKILEVMNPAEDPTIRHKTPLPRNQLRVGFATAGASLWLGEREEASVSFDTEGVCARGGAKESVSQKFGAGDVVAVVLNLDGSSANSDTVSLFKNGERASPPQPLPDSLKGKTLFPQITFKNVVVHYNFGPKPMRALPFSCRMVSDASAKDAVATPAAEKAKDGKHEVLFPTLLPDEGGFDWLDHFLEKNKNYTELSDRAIVAWAERSGLSRPGRTSGRNSNDRPEMSFGISMMDDGSIRRVLNAVAPTQPRNYVVMEVKSNLLKDERKEAVAKWAGSGFKRTAAVLVGEPPQPLKKRCQELMLQAKQETVTAEWQTKQAEEKKRKILEKRQRQLERERKKAERAAKRKQEELRRKAEAEAAAKAGEPAPEEKKEEEPEEEDEKSAEEPEEPEGEPPKAELTGEERRTWFRKLPVPDLTAQTLNASFVKFSLPEKEEGFDEVRQEWSKGDKCKEYLKQWVRDRKVSTRIEELQPGEWFTGKWKDWQKTMQAWHAKQNQHKTAVAQKEVEAAKKKAEADRKAALEKAKAEKERLEKERAEKEKAEKAEKEKAEGKEENAEEAAKEEEKKEEEKEEKKEEEKKETEEKEEKEKEEKEEEPAVDFDQLDVFGVEDVLDVGGGQPLFSNFGFEDWTMMGLRYELHLLAHAFRRDVGDPERIGIHLDHLEFYYLKYFKKALNLKFYGVESLKELLELIRDTVVISGKSQVIEALLPDDMESLGLFAMLTEESRRNRMLRIDLGEEGAKLKLSQPQVASPATATALRPGMQAPGGATVPRPAVVPGTLRPVSAQGAQGWRPVAPPSAFAGARAPAVASAFRPAAGGYQARPFLTPAWRGSSW